jgi:tRNA(Ile)-lysidine synthase TilS/MesJ
MKCYLCNKAAKIKQQKGRAVCNQCFVRLIEKRIRKQTRLEKSFKPKDKILVLGDVADYLVKSITKNMNIRIFSRKNKKINKIVVEHTLDDELNQFVKEIFQNKKHKKQGKTIKILKNITDKDIMLFAKIKGLRFKPNKKDKKFQDFLDQVQARYPNAKYNLLRNMEELRKIL